MEKRTVKLTALALTLAVSVVPIAGCAQPDSLPRPGISMSILGGAGNSSLELTPTGSIFDGLDLGPGYGSGSTPAPAFPTSEAYPYSAIKSWIQEYKATNNEVVGWLTVPNTNINIPITLNTQNNDYYVYRDWKKNYYPDTTYKNYYETATYLDFRTKLSNSWSNGSKNLVLYGHNWNNLRSPFTIGNQSGYIMFAQLPSYTSQDFAKNNPHIYFSTGENEGIWRVFSVAYCEISPNFFYNNPDPSLGQYKNLLDEWKARSLYNFGVEVDTSDRIITLSTCTRQYGTDVGERQRFVVVARLLRPGESEQDTISVSVNQNVKQPKF